MHFVKKHTTKMSDRKQGLDKIFFKNQKSISERVTVRESSVTCQPSKKVSQQVIKWAVCLIKTIQQMQKF